MINFVAVLEALSQDDMYRQRLPFERRMRGIFARRFRAQAAMINTELYRGVQESVTSLQALLLAVLDVPDEDWTANIASTLSDAIVKAGTMQFDDLLPMPTTTFTFDMTALANELNLYSGSLIRGIDEITRKRVVAILTQGAKDGLSYSAIARNLKREFRQFASPRPQRHIVDRATLIAVTEIGNAYVRGQVEAAQKLIHAGIILEKSWHTTGDDRVSEGCQANEAEGWIAFEQTFASGDQHPLRFPGCRCALMIRARPTLPIA